MTKKELIERSRKALAEFDRLPPAQQVQELIASGTINEQGEVLLGRGPDSKKHKEAETAAQDRR